MSEKISAKQALKYVKSIKEDAEKIKLNINEEIAEKLQELINKAKLAKQKLSKTITGSIDTLKKALTAFNNASCSESIDPSLYTFNAPAVLSEVTPLVPQLIAKLNSIPGCIRLGVNVVPPDLAALPTLLGSLAAFSGILPSGGPGAATKASLEASDKAKEAKKCNGACNKALKKLDELKKKLEELLKKDLNDPTVKKEIEKIKKLLKEQSKTCNGAKKAAEKAEDAAKSAIDKATKACLSDTAIPSLGDITARFPTVIPPLTGNDAYIPAAIMDNLHGMMDKIEAIPDIYMCAILGYIIDLLGLICATLATIQAEMLMPAVEGAPHGGAWTPPTLGVLSTVKPSLSIPVDIYNFSKKVPGKIKDATESMLRLKKALLTCNLNPNPPPLISDVLKLLAAPILAGATAAAVTDEVIEKPEEKKKESHCCGGGRSSSNKEDSAQYEYVPEYVYENGDKFFLPSKWMSEYSSAKGCPKMKRGRADRQYGLLVAADLKAKNTLAKSGTDIPCRMSGEVAKDLKTKDLDKSKIELVNTLSKLELYDLD